MDERCRPPVDTRALNNHLSQLVDEAAMEIGHPPRLAQLAKDYADEGFAFLEALTRP